jgi:hypothetical protein
MFGAQSRANVRYVRRQLQTLWTENLSAADYMQKMKSLADVMAAAGVPISDDELVDYVLTGLGKEFNPIAGAMTIGDTFVPFSDFYSRVLNFEAMQAAQGSPTEDWQSSANAAQRPGPYGHQSGGPPRAFDHYSPAYPGEVRPAGNYGQQGQGRYGGNEQPNRNGGNGGRNGGGNGGGGRGGGRNGRRWCPRCQLCGNWGHEASDCRSRFNHNYHRMNNSRAGNSASTSSHVPHWLADTSATDHLTSDLERLHVHVPCGGKDQVQVANGAGLSISHIGHSCLAGSSLKLKNVLHVPHIHEHLLSVYRLVFDNDVFVEFHRTFFCVKDKAIGRTLLHARSQGGLYPIPLA